ncbi:MAG: amidase domain-containing protein, partial [Clostridia bacterium]|nr:amidase domain-containing protein [Clostridia bacterium]
MTILDYDRQAAYEYAKKWAFSRNPAFYDFSKIGGDCTNFASQCIYAGAKIMNFTPTFGWFYRSANDRTPSWTGVQFLYNFLVN